MKFYELSPIDGRNSFYRKALVEIAKNGTETLYSYGTPIIKRIKNSGRLVRLYDGWTMTNLDHISWRRVDEIAKSGKAREYFALGATKKDYMKNGFVATYQIIGFDHDDLADNSGKATISWDMVNLYKDESAMRRDGNSVWWDDSDIRSFLNEDFKNNVSDDLAVIVKPVYKQSVDRNGNMQKTIDEFWLKSEQELYGRKFWSYGGEGHWYEFYAQENILYCKKNTKGENDWQWLRSVHAVNSYYFCIVNTSGSAYDDIASSSRGFAPAFCN